jgi:5-methylthioadenosine/S-adenosylhomocysteine deaminase
MIRHNGKKRYLMKVDTLIKCKWLAPMVQKNTVLANHAIAVLNGKIVAVLPNEQASKEIIAASTVELNKHLVTPGFINAHAHSPMTVMRGLADDVTLETWLQQHIWPAEKQFLEPNLIADGTKIAIAEMLLSGTTYFAEHYFYPDITASIAKECGISTQIGLWVGEITNEWTGSSSDCLKLLESSYKKWQDDDFIDCAIAPHSPYLVSDKTFEELKQIQLATKLRMHIHLHETSTEIVDSIKQFNLRPIARLEKLGALNELMQAVHMTQCSNEDLAMIKAHNVGVVHCPRSNAKLASGICNIANFKQHNIKLALGTDGAASNNNLDILAEMQAAYLISRSHGSNANNLTAYDFLEMLTISAAKALGISHKCGSIEIGKNADITAIDYNHLHTASSYDPIASLLYAAKSNQVSHVWCQGKLQVSNGALTNLDYDHIISLAKKWQHKLQPYAKKV